jgi:hypothetical protein
LGFGGGHAGPKQKCESHSQEGTDRLVHSVKGWKKDDV